MLYFWWALVAFLSAAAVSRLVRGVGAVSVIDIVAGTVAGFAGGWAGKEVIYSHSYTDHYFPVLILVFIWAQIAVVLCVWFGFGRMAPIRTELGIGPS
jgi:carbon starvation protein CstA